LYALDRWPVGRVEGRQVGRTASRTIRPCRGGGTNRIASREFAGRRYLRRADLGPQQRGRHALTATQHPPQLARTVCRAIRITKGRVWLVWSSSRLEARSLRSQGPRGERLRIPRLPSFFAPLLSKMWRSRAKMS